MIATTCGTLIVGGFDGTSLSPSFARALAQGLRGGAIVFKRNIEGPPKQIASLARAVHAASRETPLLAVDQEGGRVARLGAPLLHVPSMRTVASWGDADLAERIARAIGLELAALGFTVNFAPVLDVDTCPDSPIIGDRAFSSDPEVCARFGAAFVRGLQGAGLLACGKHFPGHGRASKDSHLELPVVTATREELERVELPPFRAALAAGLGSMMTAHVTYPALDADRPATLSRAVCDKLRSALGLRGVLFSDDLEMRAIADRWPAGEAAVLAVDAGCDALLVCSSEAQQVQALEALVREAEISPAFRERCGQACARVMEARRRLAVRPLDDDALEAFFDGSGSRAVAAEIGRKVGT